MADRYLNLRQAVVDAAAVLIEMRRETIERALDFAQRGINQAGQPRQEAQAGSV